MDSLGIAPIYQIPLAVALLFFVISHPTVFAFTDKNIGARINMPFVVAGRPTTAGLIVHAAVMFGLTWLFLKSYTMGGDGMTSFATY